MNPSLSLDEKWWPQFHPFKRRTILVVNLYMIINQVSLKEIFTQTSTYMLHFNFNQKEKETTSFIPSSLFLNQPMYNQLPVCGSLNMSINNNEQQC
jgi:hypothetical protein